MFIKRRQIFVYNLIKKYADKESEDLKVLENAWNVFNWNANMLLVSILAVVFGSVLFAGFIQGYVPEYTIVQLRVVFFIINLLLGIMICVFIARFMCVFFVKILHKYDLEELKGVISKCVERLEKENAELEVRDNYLYIAVLGRFLHIKLDRYSEEDNYTCKASISYSINPGGYIDFNESVLIYLNGVQVAKLSY